MAESFKTTQFGSLHHDNGKNMRLFRKQNGFDPGQLIDVVKQTGEVKEKVLTEKLEKIQQEQLALTQSDVYLRRFMSAAKALSNPSLASLKGEKDAFGSRNVSYASDSVYRPPLSRPLSCKIRGEVLS